MKRRQFFGLAGVDQFGDDLVVGLVLHAQSVETLDGCFVEFYGLQAFV